MLSPNVSRWWGYDSPEGLTTNAIPCKEAFSAHRGGGPIVFCPALDFSRTERLRVAKAEEKVFSELRSGREPSENMLFDFSTLVTLPRPILVGEFFFQKLPSLEKLEICTRYQDTEAFCNNC